MSFHSKFRLNLGHMNVSEFPLEHFFQHRHISVIFYIVISIDLPVMLCSFFGSQESKLIPPIIFELAVLGTKKFFFNFSFMKGRKAQNALTITHLSHSKTGTSKLISATSLSWL